MGRSIRHASRHGARQGSQRVERWFWLRVADCERWLRRRMSECRQCRECDLAVDPLDTVCRHCGCSNPAKVAVTPVHLVVGFLVAAVLAFLFLG